MKARVARIDGFSDDGSIYEVESFPQTIEVTSIAEWTGHLAAFDASVTTALKTHSPERNLASLELATSLGDVDVRSAIFQDALTFYMNVRTMLWRPAIWIDDGEIAFEWRDDIRHAMVSIEGDGHIGYTIYKDGKFRSGEVVDPTPSVMPADLKDYLLKA